MIWDSRNLCVNCSTSQLFWSNNFACRCFDQWRPSQENCTISFHNDVLICHSRDIGSSCCATSQNKWYLWDSLRRHLGHVIENSSEVAFCGENITLPWKVGSSRINQVEARKFVFDCNFLSPQMFFYSYWIISSTKSKDKYPFTVGSLATTMQNLPWMRPTPVMMPPELTSSLPYIS